MLAGMGVNIKLFHTGRRTTAGERICDALSKGEFSEVRQEMPDGKDISERASGEQGLAHVDQRPQSDQELGAVRTSGDSHAV